MRFFTACRSILATLVPALFLLVVVPGCGKQSEGERCGDVGMNSAANNDDCDDGLVCKRVNSSEEVNRCCYPDRVTDSRCEPKTGPASQAAGGASAGGASGGSDAGGSSAQGGVSGEGG